MVARTGKSIIFILSGVLLLLMVPFIAMQFSDEVNWSLFDFIVMGGLLFTTGLALKFVLSTFKNTRLRIVFILITLAVFLLIWAELAVGIFGSPFAGS